MNRTCVPGRRAQLELQICFKEFFLLTEVKCALETRELVHHNTKKKLAIPPNSF